MAGDLATVDLGDLIQPDGFEPVEHPAGPIRHAQQLVVVEVERAHDAELVDTLTEDLQRRVRVGVSPGDQLGRGSAHAPEDRRGM